MKSYVETRIAELRVRLKEHDGYVQCAKAAVVLAGRWFDQFSSREEGTIEVDGVKFEFKLGREEVEI